MNTIFDELAKNMAQSVTRRGALKKFGVGLAGIALAAFRVANVETSKGSLRLFSLPMGIAPATTSPMH
jgi:hypothetical protein